MNTPSELALATDRLAKAYNPDFVPSKDYLFGKIGENEYGITFWDSVILGTQPTSQQINDEANNPTARVQELVNKAAWDASAAAFESLSLGKQALWEPVRVKVADFIQKGDFASAYQTIATVPNLYDGMDADRTMFLALFQ
jgi:hypothetical protein